MNVNNGFIKIPRDVMQLPIWENQLEVKLWLYCLLQASHNKFGTLQAGQFRCSRVQLASDLHWSRNTVNQHLRNLEDMGYISVETADYGTIITVTDWDTLFGMEKTAEEKSCDTELESGESLSESIPEQSPSQTAPDLSIPAQEMNAPSPAQELNTPVQEMSIPAQNLSIPTPAQELSTPAQEMNIPAQNLSTPVQEMNTPAQNLSTPTPAQNLSTPAQSLNTPAQNLNSPAQNLNRGCSKFDPYQEEYQDRTLSLSTEKSGERGKRERDFETWWALYPRHEGRTEAYQAYMQLDASPAKLLAALEKAKNSRQWHQANGRFIPSAAKWLDGTWMDYLDEDKTKKKERKSWMTY